MSRLIITEENEANHKWWHSWVPNYNVSFETVKYTTMWVTKYNCHWCDWNKTIVRHWTSEEQKNDTNKREAGA
jgi:hypothetical protein